MTLHASSYTKEEDTDTLYSSASSAYTSESMNEQPLQYAQGRLPETAEQLAHSSDVPVNIEELDDEAPTHRE